ncbi:phospholipase D family protein [Agaribacterium haliotis]|uniref:phospholipase D family protein n=1 Tax=Agaribacterium haliotis TaxID=2013869 RepID=UPI001304489F|nr:phospholipase D family protein [Agaribacterium haliotis]
MHKLKQTLFVVFLICLASCASLPENKQQISSSALLDTGDSLLAHSVDERREKDAIAADKTGMLLLDNGLDAMVARLVLIKLAEQSLDVQYYLYHSDLSGGIITYELWKAAERGVRVRLLLDDMDMAGKDKDLAILDSHPNIEIRLFNPFIRGKSRTGQFLTRFGSVTRRAHNKALIADNQLAIIGGRNIGDEYFDANPNMAFGDLDVTLTNPAAREVSNEFDLYWNDKLAYPVSTLAKHQPTQAELDDVEKRMQAFVERNRDNIYFERLRNSGIIQRTKNAKNNYFWGEVEVLYDDPQKISSDREQTHFHMAPRLVPHIESVKQQLLVISPYFVPGKEGVAFFNELQQRGVQVRILTNSLTSNDVAVVHAGYSRYRKDLLNAGVQLYELDKTLLEQDYARNKSSRTREGLKGSQASLHAKYFVMDRSHAFIGSLNLDPRSVVENTEIGAVILSPELASKLADDFEKNIKQVAFEVRLVDGKLHWQREGKNGQLIEFDKEPYSSWWDRFKNGFMRLLPGESQL